MRRDPIKHGIAICCLSWWATCLFGKFAISFKKNEAGEMRPILTMPQALRLIRAIIPHSDKFLIYAPTRRRSRSLRGISFRRRRQNAEQTNRYDKNQYNEYDFLFHDKNPLMSLYLSGLFMKLKCILTVCLIVPPSKSL